MTDIVKRGGQRPNQAFDPAKLHYSIATSCLSLRCPEGQSNQVADAVTAKVTAWLGSKSIVTSADIRRRAGLELAKLHEEAAYLYQHQPELL